MIRLGGILLTAVMLARTAAGQDAGVPQTNAPTVLPTVTVTATNGPSSLTSPSIKAANEQKHQVPGGLTIRDSSQMERGRGANFQDLLGGIPGLTLQSENGMEVSKVSIRGSGILSEDEPLGVIFLLDGFPFNQGDGEVILEDFSLGAIQYSEVFRGADAFKYGAITLGGAVNLVSKTGYDADPLKVELEGGSYGFLRTQVSSGGVDGPVDYYVSVTGRTREGYREHSYENTEDLFSDIGYKFNNNLENRFYLTVDQTDRLLPGGITKEQMEQDPRQVDPLSIAQDLNKQWYYLRLADKVSFKTDSEEADAGMYWWHRNLLTRGLYVTNSPTGDNTPDGTQGYYSDNFGWILNSTTHGQLFGQQNVLSAGLTPTVETEVDANYQNLSGHEGALTAHDAELSINAPLYVEDQQYVTEKLSLLAGLQAIYDQRHFHDYFNQTPSGDQSANLVFRTLSPKAGMIYEFDNKSQAFANFSRSWQPPSFDNMVDFGDDPGDSLEFTPLASQHAWTAEVGTRGEEGRFGWELSLYHSWVRNELLDVNDAFGVDRGAVNINRSYHQGIEAGLDIELWNSILAKKSKDRDGDRLTFKQTYTLNDFHFDGDPVYGNNRIAGIPIHLYQAELLYEAPCGFYAGPNLQWNMTRYPVDHANTLYADGYALLGFKMGFQVKKGFSIFFEARNLTDERYASSVDPIPDARTATGPIEIFHPGDGRSFYAGVSWSL
jgi:iron complex outermembrane recepter protein